ncbi:MAG: class I fructose-bisphosphate aldolase [Marinoscillum sp.]
MSENGILAKTQDAYTKGLLDHQCQTIVEQDLTLPGPKYIDDVLVGSNRSPQVLKSMAELFNHGNLSGTGYINILPVDQGIEHSAGSAFAPNSMYFDPENIIKLAIEGGCNAIATTFGGLAIHARKYAHKIPYIVKLNHNQLLTKPTTYNQVMYGSVKEAWNLGATAVGATVYFGSPEQDQQLREVAEAFEEAHSLGMVTILWCYTRNEEFVQGKSDYHTAADLTGQANHLGVTIQADIIKQKLPTTNGGFKNLKFGKYHDYMYEHLSSDHPIDMCRYQVANCYMGKIGLISSGGASSGENDLEEAVQTAIINKRAGGMGLILGRKAFQRSFHKGVELLQAVQSVYKNEGINVA